MGYARGRRYLTGNDSGTVSVESRYAPQEILSLGLRPGELSAPGGEDGQSLHTIAVRYPSSSRYRNKAQARGDRVHKLLGSKEQTVANRLLGEWQGRGSMADAESSELESGAPIFALGRSGRRTSEHAVSPSSQNTDSNFVGA